MMSADAGQGDVAGKSAERAGQRDAGELRVRAVGGVGVVRHGQQSAAEAAYLHSLISVQLPRVIRSSSVVTLSRPPTSSSLRITNRSFRYASPHLWNQLPVSFRQPYKNTLLMMSHSLIYLPPAHHSHPPSHIHCFIPGSKLTFSTNLFHHSLLAPTWTAFSDYIGPDLLCS